MLENRQLQEKITVRNTLSGRSLDLLPAHWLGNLCWDVLFPNVLGQKTPADLISTLVTHHIYFTEIYVIIYSNIVMTEVRWAFGYPTPEAVQ